MSRSAGTLGATGARILSRERSEALGWKILSLLSVPHALLRIASREVATTEFARGDAHMATENVAVSLSLFLADATGRTGTSTTTRVDDAGLRAFVADAQSAAAEHTANRTAGQFAAWLLGPQTYPNGPELFLESALPAMTPVARARVFHTATAATEAARLVGAGDLEFEIATRALFNTKGFCEYERTTYGEFSLTARTQDGTGSGWAWGGHEDWSRVSVDAVAARAVDLAQRSAKPVAVEPGRYTVILEPAAVASLVEQMTAQPRFYEDWANMGRSTYSREPRGTNKIGLQMLDRRLRLVSDPWDPELPTSVMGTNGEPLAEVEWFQRGELAHLVGSARWTGGVRLAAEGPTQTLDEMIASTRRGIWVNRLWNLSTMHEPTLLLTGTTRDGTFLIENGKITKAIKNFRFTESPFFVFNKLDAFGEPVRASRSVVAPRMKVRDFDFTSLTDAV